MWTQNILKMELYENDKVTIFMWFPCPTFPQTQIKHDRWLLRVQISPVRSVDGKHLKLFQSVNAVFKFLWRSVEGIYENSCPNTDRLSLSFYSNFTVTFHETCMNKQCRWSPNTTTAKKKDHQFSQHLLTLTWKLRITLTYYENHQTRGTGSNSCAETVSEVRI